MNRQRHAREAQIRLDEAVNSVSAGDLTSAGESIWATVVHAVSAADPGHETTNPDRFQNAHRAPNTRNQYEDAAARISSSNLTKTDYDNILRVAQGHLHNNYYHLHLQPTQLSHDVAWGLFHASILNGVAQNPVHPTPPQGP